MRVPAVLVCAVSAAWLSACGGEAEEEAIAVPIDGEAAPASVGALDPGQSDQVAGATPMEERIATIGLLNKRNNVAQDLEMRPGEVVEEGPVIIRLDACERSAPWEMPRQTGAFVQVDILNRGDSDHSRVFSGWLFKETPSINVVEHPIYDVWIKDCAMSFPGDE